MYGFIVGKIARARKLHLTRSSTLRARKQGLAEYHLEGRKDTSSRLLSTRYHDRGILFVVLRSFAHRRVGGLVHPESGSSPALWDVPENILSALGLGASRNRNRLMELLSILEDLRLFTPLQQSQSETPFLTCEQNGAHPSSFDVVPQESWSTSAANLAPKYWHIRPSAPVHLWASPTNPPPFWKTFPLRTTAEGEDFWNNLKEVCLNPSSVEKVQNEERLHPRTNPTSLSELTTARSWVARDVLHVFASREFPQQIPG
jgi:hypothetical protein